jgi:hypothetical protein
MARTNSAAVQSLLGPNYDCTTDLTPFIQTANGMADRVAACAAAKGKALTPQELQSIEGWLAAHFYAQMDQLYKSKSTGGASASFQGETGKGLESTLYGQSALMADYSGCLTVISKRQVARLNWLGKPVSEQIPYDQRD